MFVFVGNSHLDALVNNLDPQLYTKIQSIGASIKGLINPTSKLGLRERIEDSISSNKHSIYIFLLGQVDVEFGYYYKCVKGGKKIEFELYVTELIEAYRTYLETFKKQFIVCSIYPSVIKNIEHNFLVSFKEDNGLEGQYSEYNDTILHSLKIFSEYYTDSYNERLDKCRFFNTKLSELCKAMNYKYIDLWDELMTGEYEVNSRYVPRGDKEHHLAFTIPSEYILYKIQEAIGE